MTRVRNRQPISNDSTRGPTVASDISAPHQPATTTTAVARPTVVERSSASLGELRPAAATGPTGHTPLEARLSNLTLGKSLPSGMSGATLVETMASLLGVDPQALGPLSNADLFFAGHLDLDIDLRDAMSYTLPIRNDVNGGSDLEINVPRSPYGTTLHVEIKLGLAEETDDLATPEPIITEVRAWFRPARGEPMDRRLPEDRLPRITNPSALKPSGNALVDAGKDALADVVLRGFSVNAEGKIHLDADVVAMGGMSRQDFHELAKDSLPTLHMDLSRLLKGDLTVDKEEGADPSRASVSAVSGKPGSDPPESRFGLSELLLGFATVADQGRWRLELCSDGEDPASVRSTGSLIAGDYFRLKVDAEVEAISPGHSARLSLSGRNDGERGGVGAAVLTAKVDAEAAQTLKTTWTPDGMQLDGVEAGTVLPLDLKPWDGPGPAPKIGSAEFWARLSALLEADAPLVHAEAVQFLRYGTEVLNNRLELINSAGADDTVLLQTYILKDDTTGSQVVDALIAAHQRGANVKILLDAVGSTDSPGAVVEGSEAVQRLRAAGVDVRLFNNLGGATKSLIEMFKLLRRDPDLADLAKASFPELGDSIERIRAFDVSTQSLNDPRTLVQLGIPLLRVVANIQDLRDHPVDESVQALLRNLDAVLDITQIDAQSEPVKIAARMLPDLGRDHRKMLAVYATDGDSAHPAELMVGGNNIADAYQLEPDSPYFDPALHGELNLWNDAHLRIRGGSVVAQGVRGFVESWSRSGEEQAVPLPHVDSDGDQEVPLRVVNHQPLATARGQSGDNHFTNCLLAMLEGLGRGDRMVIENPYFLPVPELRRAMLDAAQRGARIDIVTNGPYPNNDAKLIAELSRQFVLPELVDAPNINIYETRASSQPIHRKTVVVETDQGQHAYIVGSQNLDRLSAGVNREMFVLGGKAVGPHAAPAFDASVDAPARQLLLDAARDLDPAYSRRLTRHDRPTSGEAIVKGYVDSLLWPVL